MALINLITTRKFSQLQANHKRAQSTGQWGKVKQYYQPLARKHPAEGTEFLKLLIRRGDRCVVWTFNEMIFHAALGAVRDGFSHHDICVFYIQDDGDVRIKDISNQGQWEQQWPTHGDHVGCFQHTRTGAMFSKPWALPTVSK